MSNQKNAVVAIIRNGDRFLLVKRSNYKEVAAGYWCPVSGSVEQNETQIEALQREVKEEIGLDIKAIRKICSIPSHDQLYNLHFWTTQLIAGEVSITSDEATDFKWLTVAEMKKLELVFNEDISIFEKLMNGEFKNDTTG